MIVVGMVTFWSRNIVGEVTYDVTGRVIVCYDKDFSSRLGESNSKFSGFFPYYLKEGSLVKMEKHPSNCAKSAFSLDS